mmetsp:Transcript_7043/g.7685  ORF Transcript_7043/g.7685 Transcript_7043/m.7685 type:complete len:195 (-) Transcript_7043:171-755(-)
MTAFKSMIQVCVGDMPFFGKEEVEEIVPLTEEERLEAIKEQHGLTEKDINEFRNDFVKFDADGNGCLDNMEIRNALFFLGYDLTDGELEEIISEFDKNGNGYIEFPEFVTIMAIRINGAKKEEEYKKIFQNLDKDGNGFLSQKELTNGLKKLSDELDCDEEDIIESFAEVTKNIKGELKYSDFVKVLRFKNVLQ